MRSPTVWVPGMSQTPNGFASNKVLKLESMICDPPFPPETGGQVRAYLVHSTATTPYCAGPRHLNPDVASCRRG